MLTTKLRPYQNAPVDKFIERGNLLMAWEQGTGKTVGAIAASEDLLGQQLISQCAYVVPASLKYQWGQAIAQHTDTPKRTVSVGLGETIVLPTEDVCVMINGDINQRNDQYQQIRDTNPDYVIMGYENVVNDWANVRRMKPGMIGLDEITAIKTFRAARTKKIKRWSAPYRLGMTGTPIENRPEELYSIMQWVDDDVLGRFDLFDMTFIMRNKWGAVVRYKNLPTLHQKLQPVLSRKVRKDPDVAPYMPKETPPSVWPVRATRELSKAYEHIAKDLIKALKQVRNTNKFDVFAHYSGISMFDETSQQGKIMAMQVALEMLLDHPDLVRISASNYADTTTKLGSKYAYELVESGILNGLEGSPKLDVLFDGVEGILKDPDAKVIIFSRFREMLDILEREFVGIDAVQFHGKMSAQQKAGAISRFTKDANTKLFLSSHAGGYGIDMYMANHLINYDLAYSSGRQDQIDSRHVRGSSEFEEVFVHNLLVTNSTEYRNFDRLAFKRAVASAVLDNTGSDSKGRVENDVVGLRAFLEANPTLL